jgi:hypothetical protein
VPHPGCPILSRPLREGGAVLAFLANAKNLFLFNSYCGKKFTPVT